MMRASPSLLMGRGVSALIARASLGGALGIMCGACSSAPSPSPSMERIGHSSAASSGLTRSLWILNQGGTPALEEFFKCVLGAGSNWNTLANTYADGESLTFGAQVMRNDDPCGLDYQCAVDKGNFDIQTSDVLLVVIPDSGYGGQNGRQTITNPHSALGMSINVSYVRTSPDPMYQTIYGGHEVFEAQTDGVSGDCCDGETSSGGPFNWCAQCGPFNGGYGACGQYAPGGSVGGLGIDTIQCSNGTFKYQHVSPANHEFDGTCPAITPGSPGPATWDCASSDYQGMQYWTCANGDLNECDANGQPKKTSCNGHGCESLPSGMNDVCKATPDGGTQDGGATEAGSKEAGAASDGSGGPEAGDSSLLDGSGGPPPISASAPGGNGGCSAARSVRGGSDGFVAIFGVLLVLSRRRRRGGL